MRQTIKAPEFKATTKRNELSPEWVKSLTREDYTLYYNKWIKDHNKECIYGWVELQNDKWRAGHPALYDEETDSDATDLGYYNTKEEAMIAVESSNNPFYSNDYI